MISGACTLWCALRTRRILPVLLWATGLLEEKMAIAVSGWSWSDETVAFDVHRSLCGDIINGLLTVGTSEWSWEGRPRRFDLWLLTESDRRAKKGGPSRVYMSEVLPMTPRMTSCLLILRTCGAAACSWGLSCRVP